MCLLLFAYKLVIFDRECAFVSAECRDVLLPMMLRELRVALETMADGPHDERRNSLELLNNILEVLSRNNVVRHMAAIYGYTSNMLRKHNEVWGLRPFVDMIRVTVNSSRRMVIFTEQVFDHVIVYRVMVFISNYRKGVKYNHFYTLSPVFSDSNHD